MEKIVTCYGRMYRSTTSSNPEDWGHHSRDPLDNIREYLKGNLIALSDTRFIAQDDSKNVYFIMLSDDFPPRRAGEYKVRVEIESFTQSAPKDLADLLFIKGFHKLG